MSKCSHSISLIETLLSSPPPTSSAPPSTTSFPTENVHRRRRHMFILRHATDARAKISFQIRGQPVAASWLLHIFIWIFYTAILTIFCNFYISQHKKRPSWSFSFAFRDFKFPPLFPFLCCSYIGITKRG